MTTFTQAHPPLPSVKRWVSLCRQFPGASTLRKLQYEHLDSLDFSGRVLDVGGGSNANYLNHLPEDIEYQSINIDPDIAPTWLVNVGDRLPPEDNSYDCCLSLNTLEHVYDPQFLIAEIYRVLKPGGQFHATVPWMFRIHGHPDDFLRMTPSWWGQALREAGFKETTVTPLVWGRSSSAASMSGRRGLRVHAAHIQDSVHASFAFGGRRKHGKRRQRVYNIALGHFISARK